MSLQRTKEWHRTTGLKRTAFTRTRRRRKNVDAEKRKRADKRAKGDDSSTSRLIRARDNWTCVRCNRTFIEGSKELTCSHFYRRSIQSVRHDPDNLDSLCQTCHLGADGWEHQKHEGAGYYMFKLSQLGVEGFEALRVRARVVKGYEKRVA